MTLATAPAPTVEAWETMIVKDGTSSDAQVLLAAIDTLGPAFALMTFRVLADARIGSPMPSPAMGDAGDNVHESGDFRLGWSHADELVVLQRRIMP